MTKVDDPMPEVKRAKVMQHLQNQQTPTRSRERKTGVEWLRERLADPRESKCERGHYHAECTDCGRVACCSPEGYDQFEETRLQCSNCHGVTTHLVVPFDTFGRHVRFPN